MPYEQPRPDRTLAVETAGGAEAAVRRYASDGPVRLFLSHGNGFAIDGYRHFWERLHPGFELIVFDQRNHGLNPPSPAEHHRYRYFAEDLEHVFTAVADRCPRKVNVGVFHSLSARAAMIQALESAWLWDALILFDPPTAPPFPSDLRDRSVKYNRRLADWAMERQAVFDSITHVVDLYRDLPSTRNCTPESIEALAHAVVRRDGERWRLRCPPELEARLYRENTAIRIWPAANDFPGPVLLVGSESPDGRPNPPGESNRLLAEAGGFEFTTVPGAGHMMQLERPEACARLVTEFIAGIG